MVRHEGDTQEGSQEYKCLSTACREGEKINRVLEYERSGRRENVFLTGRSCSKVKGLEFQESSGIINRVGSWRRARHSVLTCAYLTYTASVSI